MPLFCCVLCQEEYSILKNHCPTCETIKRIINVYSKEKVLEILQRVCLRKSEKLQNYKIKDIKKEIEKDNIGNTKNDEKEITKMIEEDKDRTYIDNNISTLNKDFSTLNQNLLDDLKFKLKNLPPID